MKVHTGVQKRCASCKIIKRHGRIMVVCPTKRHKQAQGVAKRKKLRLKQRLISLAS